MKIRLCRHFLGLPYLCQIGYYHLVAAIPDVVKGTDFERVASVFQNAWPRIQNAIDTAGRYGIGVLLDLHCAAGKS